MNTAMQHFTGGITETYELSSSPLDLYEIMLNAYKNSALLGAGILVSFYCFQCGWSVNSLRQNITKYSKFVKQLNDTYLNNMLVSTGYFITTCSSSPINCQRTTNFCTQVELEKGNYDVSFFASSKDYVFYTPVELKKRKLRRIIFYLLKRLCFLCLLF